MGRLRRFEDAMDRFGKAFSNGVQNVCLLLFTLLFSLMATNFVEHPLTWIIYAMTSVFFATFLFHACWGHLANPSEGRSWGRILLIAFFFGMTILSTAISHLALMLTFVSFGAFAFFYLARENRKGNQGREPSHKAFPWWGDAVLLVLQVAEILVIAIVGGVAKAGVSISLAILGASLIGTFLLLAFKRGKKFARSRLISYSLCILTMVIPAILACFSANMPMDFRYFLFPALGIPLTLAFLFRDLIRGRRLIERFKVPFRAERKDPCGWTWRLLARSIGCLFLVLGAAGTIVLYQASSPEPCFMAFLSLFATLFFFHAWPLALFYPSIRKGNPLRVTLFASIFFLFLLCYSFVAMLYALAIQEGWEPMRELATPFVFVAFFLAFLALAWFVDAVDLKVIVESRSPKFPSVAIFLGILVLYCNFALFGSFYVGGNPSLRIAMACLCALGYASGQAVLAWNERLFFLRAGFVVLYVLSLALPFLFPNPLVGFLLSSASLSILSATMDAFLPSNPLDVVSLGYRPAF